MSQARIRVWNTIWPLKLNDEFLIGGDHSGALASDFTVDATWRT